MERIVVLDRDTLSVPVPRPSFAHEWVEHAHTGREQVAARVAGASIVVSNKVRIDEAALTAAPALRLIAIPATGTNNVELEACRRRGVTVCNVPSYGPQSVAEHVFALVLALRRNLLQYVAEVRAGRWERAPNFCFVDHPIADLAGSRLGVVGSGAIGSAVARIGAGFGMQVLQAERRGAAAVRPGHVAFDEVLERADVLSLHLPLTPQTHHLIGAAELARMKPGAVLINTARGPLVDESALAAALRAGRIGGAGLDVLAEEPPRPGSSPLLADDLRDNPRLLVTPHVAWASRAAQTKLVTELIANLEAFVAGRARNVVS
mgnify:CR=1 FL=1